MRWQLALEAIAQVLWPDYRLRFFRLRRALGSGALGSSVGLPDKPYGYLLE